MQAWNWPGSAGFQGAVFPGTDINSATPIPPSTGATSGYPMSGYPYYGPGAMPQNMPGYATQPWGLAQQQYQQWEQWQQQYAEWQKQYGDKYQAQMMTMAGGIPGTVPVPPPAQTTDAKTSSQQSGSAANRSDNLTAGVTEPQAHTTSTTTTTTTATSDGGTKRPYESGKDEKNGSEQANKKLRESQDDISEAEKVFDQQFRNWEDQYNKWKAQNVNHPDKDQYREYEAKWESWREQLLLKREQMRKKKGAKTSDSKASSSNVSDQVPSTPESSSTDQEKHVTSTGGAGKQAPVPPPVTSTAQQQSSFSFNPMNPIQAFNFPSFNTPPPMIQQPMGFPSFGNQHFSMSQQQPYGMQQGMFSNQPLFPGMGMMGTNQPPGMGMMGTNQSPGMGMMGTPPLMMNMNTSADVQKSSSVSDSTKKEHTPEQPSLGSGAQLDKNKSFEDKNDTVNVINKGDMGRQKMIPGLDLLDQSGIKDTGMSDRVSDRKGTGAFREMNERQSFNKPPPGFPSQSQGPQRSHDRPDFGPGGNFSFTKLPPPNFGPPPGQNRSGFGSNYQFGSTSQPPPNLLPPNNNRQDSFQDVPGFNNKIYNQNNDKPFDKNPVGSQNFDSDRKLPSLMDGFDPTKGPPMFAKPKNENAEVSSKSDKVDHWENRGPDSFQENSRSYDNYELTNKFPPEKSVGGPAGHGDVEDRGFQPKGDIKFDKLHRQPGPNNFEHNIFSRGVGRFGRGGPTFSPGTFGGPGRKSEFDGSVSELDRPGNMLSRNTGLQDNTGTRHTGLGFPKMDDRFPGLRGNFSLGPDRFNTLGNRSREGPDRGDNKPDNAVSGSRGIRGPLLDRFDKPEGGFIGRRGPADAFPGKFDTDDRGMSSDKPLESKGSDNRSRMLDTVSGPPRVYGSGDRCQGDIGGPDNRYSGPKNLGDFSNNRFAGPTKIGDKPFSLLPFPMKQNESHVRKVDTVSQGPHSIKSDTIADKTLGHSATGGKGFLKDREKIFEDMSQKKSDSPFPKSGKPELGDTRFGGTKPWEEQNKFGPAGDRNSSFKGYSRDFDERRGPVPLPVIHNVGPEWTLPPPTVIDYGHKPASFASLSDLDIPESLEPMQTFDYAHGANPGPAVFKDNWRKLYDLDEWQPERDGRQPRGREGSDKFAPRGRWHDDTWKDDRQIDRGDRGGRGRGRDRGEWNPRGRDGRDGRDQWKDDRDSGTGKSNDKQDRFDRNYRNDKNDRNSRTDTHKESRRDEKDQGDRRQVKGTSSNRLDSRYRDFDDSKRSRNRYDNKQKEEKSSNENVEQEPAKPPTEDKKPLQRSPAVLIEDLLNAPGRFNRPHKIAVILRGPPGSGKTFVAKLIKDKEVEMGGSAPRILSLDDYFMVETETEETDPESGRKVTKKGMVYEYEEGMEEQYRQSLAKTFRKTIQDGYFPFIILDCINNKLEHYEELYQFAKQKNFQVYICEMDMDVSTCAKRNTHKRTEEEIKTMIKKWEPTPFTQTLLDVRSLLQSVSITEVDMEDTVAEETEKEKEENGDKPDDSKGEGESGEDSTDVAEGLGALLKSKWDNTEHSGEKLDRLDRLDGLAKARKSSDTIKDWLQLPEDYYESSQSVSGKKRVRWADLEERREQEKMRAIGFVVGQTDWSRMMDPSYGEDKLTQTKYI